MTVQGKVNLADAPELEGWTNFSGAAEILEKTRARVYQMAEEGKFEVRRVPYTKIYLVKIEELERIRAGWASEHRSRAEALAR